MKNFLQDLIQHTYGLGVIDLLKVEGSSTETKISAYADDRTVIIMGKFKEPVTGVDGVFGMPNLGKLKTIVNFDEYNDSSKITITYKTDDSGKIPTNIHFETSTGDFVNDFRLMGKTLIEDKVKSVTFKGAKWNVEVEPTMASIQRMKKQASANSEEPNFVAKTDNGDLKFYFGDVGAHSGNFVFQSGVTGTLLKSWSWPVKVFMAIMDLPGDKVIKFSDSGAAEITVDSGIADYTYLLPAQAK
jgi:hypothetical protein